MGARNSKQQRNPMRSQPAWTRRQLPRQSWNPLLRPQWLLGRSRNVCAPIARLSATRIPKQPLWKMSTVWLRFDAEQSDDDGVLYRVIDEFVKYRKPKGDASTKPKSDNPKVDKPAGAAKITIGLFSPLDISSLANQIIMLQSHGELGVGANMLGSKVPSFVIPPFTPGDVIPFQNCVAKLTGTDINADKLKSLFEIFAKTNALYLAPLKEKRVAAMDSMEDKMKSEVSKIRDAIGGNTCSCPGMQTRLQSCSDGSSVCGRASNRRSHIWMASPITSRSRIRHKFCRCCGCLDWTNPADLQSHLAQLGTGEGK